MSLVQDTESIELEIVRESNKDYRALLTMAIAKLLRLKGEMPEEVDELLPNLGLLFEKCEAHGLVCESHSDD